MTKKNTINLQQLDSKKRNADEAYFGKGIKLAASFDLGAAASLDSRSTVKTLAQRDEHLLQNRAYEGMLVYVEENQVTYQLVNGAWKEFGFNGSDFEAGFAAGIVDNLTSTETDKALSANQGRVLDEKITELKNTVDNIDLTWDKIEEKPFEQLSTSFTVSDDTKTLDVKIDENTLTKLADGEIAVKDGVFATADHNHDDVYAPISHSQDDSIHLTADEKANVGKIPTIESDVNLLKTTVGASSAHIIVQTLAELPGLIDTNNHATIAHVIETKETYILEKNEDSNGNGTTPEWIKLSDADALISVDWSVINNTPFSTVSEGLTVDGEALKVATDEATLEIADGKVKVKDGVFAAEGHTHVVDFNEVVNKPVAFTKEYTEANFIDGVDEDAGLFYLVVDHNKNSKNLKIAVIGNDGCERFVGIEYDSENTVKIWSDEKESVTVIVNSLDYVTTTVPAPPVQGPGAPGDDEDTDVIAPVAVVGKAKVGTAKVSSKK